MKHLALQNPVRVLQLSLVTLPLLLAGCGSVSPKPTAPSSNSVQSPSAFAAMAVANALPIGNVSASAFNSGYPATNTTDDNLNSWWSANGDGQFITYDLGALQDVSALHLAWYRGNARKATFDVQASKDGVTWTTLLSRAVSSGTTLQLERYALPTTNARFMRVVGHGNTENSAIAITEAAVEGAGSSAADAAFPSEKLSISAASASATNTGTSVAGSYDNNPSTMWSAGGAGQWIRYDLGALKTVSAVDLAWYKGDLRKTTFDVALSSDGSTWTSVLTGMVSTGTTLNPEHYAFAPTNARFVRVTGQGNTENGAVAITEASILGANSTLSASLPRSVYLDCAGGDDNADGISPAEAWRSITRANGSQLRPGDSLLLKRGCTWTGPLNAAWSGTASSPVTIGAYGSGDMPLIRNGRPGAVAVSGQYQVIQNLQVTADKPPVSASAVNCKTTPLGWTAGFTFTDTARYNTLQNAKAYGMTAGVHLTSGSAYNKVLRNSLLNNTVMSANTPPSVKYDDDSGAWGILVNGDNNEVAYNSFSGNTACSEDYGVEGASIEVYKASGNSFHHNTSINDTTFTELGGTSSVWSRDNTYAYNLYAPINTGGELLVLRGLKSGWGANPGTKFYNNTAYAVSTGIACFDGCTSDILSAYNNIVVSRADAKKGALYADGPFDEGNNVYFRLGGLRIDAQIVNGQIASSSKLTDPRFVDPSTQNFQLSGTSPALNAGNLSPVSALGIGTDLAGNATPIGTIDMGAFERQ